MEQRFCNLRKRLDQFGYRQQFDISSLSLVEKMLSDIVVTTDQLKGARIQEDLLGAHKTCQQHSPDHSNHSECLKLLKDNNELHQRIILIKEDWEKDVKALNAQLRKLDSENTDLQFLNSQYLAKSQQLERIPKKGAQALTGVSKKLIPAVQPQRPIATAKSTPGTSQATDVAKSAGPDRLADLKGELNSVKDSLEQLDDFANTLKKQVATRDAEIGRLTKLIESKPLCGCTLQQSVPSCSDHAVAHLNMEMEYLQRLNQDLEKRLKEALNCGREAQAKCSNLGTQCKQLQSQLTEKECVTQALHKQRQNLVSTADHEMSEAKEEFEQLYAKLQSMEAKLSRADDERLELVKENEELLARLTKIRAESSAATDKLESENRALTVKLSQATTNETLLQAALRSQPAGRNEGSETSSSASQVNQVVERQRDIYRDQVMRLSRIVEESQEAEEDDNNGGDMRDGDDEAAQATSTPRPKRVTPTAVSFQNEKLVRLLEDERDYYKREWERAAKPSSKSGPQSQESFEVAELTKKLLAVQGQKDELNKTMESLEKHVSETNCALQEALQEKSKLQAVHDKALAAWESQKQKATAANAAPTKTRLPLGVFELQRNYEKMSMDLDRARTEVDDLRDRLRLATETQITERKRLERRIDELVAEVQAGSSERAELVARGSSNQALLSNMQEENRLLQTQLSEIRERVLREKNAVNKFQSLAETNENAVKEAQRLLSQKVAERNQLEKRIQDSDSHAEQLDRVIEKQKDEMAALAKSNKALDKEKDRVQAEADDKTEKLAALKTEIGAKCREMDSQRTKIANLESRLDRLMAELVSRESDCDAWKRKSESLKGEVQEGIRYHNVLVAQKQLLEDNVTTLTDDNQALDRELRFVNEERELLKRQVHEYIAEVSRVEALLRNKEQERSGLLQQFNNLSSSHLHVESERVQLESRHSDSRMELAAKETELRTSLSVIDGLSREVREYRLKQHDQEQQVQNLRRDVLEMESRLAECQRERESLQRDVLALRELCVNLDSKKDNVAERLGNKAKEVDQLEVSISTMQQELDSLRMQIASERSSNENLEQLLNSQRQKEFLFDLNNHELTDEVNQLKDRCRRTECRLEEQTELAGRYRDRVSDLEIELNGIKRQLTNERFERERLNQELRKSGRVSSPGTTSVTNREEVRQYSTNNNMQARTITTEHGSRQTVEYSTQYSNKSSADQKAAPTVKVIPPPDASSHSTDNERGPPKLTPTTSS